MSVRVDPNAPCRREHVGFYRRNSAGNWVCSECTREGDAARYAARKAADPEGIRKHDREAMARWRAANPQPKNPRSRICDADWIECLGCKVVKPRDDYAPSTLANSGRRCRSCLAARNKAWKTANPDKVASYMEAWRTANAEHLIECEQRRYASDPEAHRARATAYRATETGRRNRALLQQDRNARAAGLVNTLTDAEWTALVEACGGRCLACGRDDVPLTRDHIVPLTKGAPLTLDNTQPLCRSCNSRKKIKDTDYRTDEIRSWVKSKAPIPSMVPTPAVAMAV